MSIHDIRQTPLEKKKAECHETLVKVLEKAYDSHRQGMGPHIVSCRQMFTAGNSETTLTEVELRFGQQKGNKFVVRYRCIVAGTKSKSLFLEWCHERRV